MVQETKAASMTQTPPSPTALRVSALSQNTSTAFELRPKKAELTALAAQLEVLALRKLSFVGTVSALGAVDWQLDATLGFTVVQPCAVTVEPVTTRIDVPVRRLYQRDYIDVDAPEAEVLDDDEVEPLTHWIDPGDVMIEALVLHLPLYPRAPGAELGAVMVSEPGVRPMTDEDARPFAGLAALKEQLKDD